MDGFRIASALLLLALRLGAAPCTGPLSGYQGYRVGQVRITSPAGFFSAASHGLDRLAESLPLRPGAPFDVAQYSAGTSRITAAVRAGIGDSSALRLVATAGTVENCDTATGTIDVRYIVYAAIVPQLAGRSFERREEESERPATAGAGLGAAGRLLVMPLAGYNQTRGMYGGLGLRFRSVELSSAASGNSFTGSIAATNGPWHLTAAYRDVPAGELKLVQSTFAAGYFGSSNSFRYAASLEGGQQGTAGASPYCDLKMLAGVSGRSGPIGWSATYGFEMGRALAKHIVDLGYTASFVPRPRTRDDRPHFIGTPHHPLTIEARLGAGVIQPFGEVPPEERFFGGNGKVAFIEGAPWDVRGQPFIRSIPENRLGGIGGTRFYASNLTVAKAVYARPLLPRELGTSEFVSNLDFAVNTAKGELSDAYLAKDPALAAVGDAIPAIEEVLDALKQELAPLPAGAFASDLGRASRTVASIRGGSALGSVLAGTILPKLEADLAGLAQGLATPSAARIGELQQRLAAAREVLSATLCGPARDAARQRADERAARDLSTARNVLDTLLYELNVYSVAPVAIFDVARVWPSGAPVQYAAGGGLRLSLLNLNFTVGYAANLRHAPGTPRGAAFVSLDVANLFH